MSLVIRVRDFGKGPTTGALCNSTMEAAWSALILFTWKIMGYAFPKSSPSVSPTIFQVITAWFAKTDGCSENSMEVQSALDLARSSELRTVLNIKQTQINVENAENTFLSKMWLNSTWMKRPTPVSMS